MQVRQKNFLNNIKTSIKVREIKIKTGMLLFGRALVVAGITGTVRPTEGIGAFPERIFNQNKHHYKKNK